MVALVLAVCPSCVATRADVLELGALHARGQAELQAGQARIIESVAAGDIEAHGLAEDARRRADQRSIDAGESARSAREREAALLDSIPFEGIAALTIPAVALAVAISRKMSRSGAGLAALNQRILEIESGRNDAAK